MISPDDRCLIVESNFLILLDLEGMVESLGFKRIDQATSFGEAKNLIKAKRYRVALLDFNVGTQDGIAIAKDLKKRKIPFAITTTFHDPSVLPPELHGVPLIAKPYSETSVNKVMLELLELSP